MIIFINGAFGAGKTTTAKLLEEKMAHERTGDFQDFDLWKVITV